MTYVDSFYSNVNTAASAASGASTTDKGTLGKDEFLQLLVTQLQHQDPLNPLDDKEFIAQLAQFSSLEQMNNIAAGIETLNTTLTKQDSLSAANYIGKDVVAEGNSVTKIDSSVTPLYFTLEDAASQVKINVYDGNGNIMKTETLNSMQAGEYNFTWDGLDYNGKQAANGQYSVYFAAEDANGDSVFVDTQVSGTIVGITKSADGTYFKLSDGRTVSFDSISMISQPVTSTVSSENATESEG